MTKYLIEVSWSDEDQGFIAIVPDPPSCSAFGETATEAVRELEDAQLKPPGSKPAASVAIRFWCRLQRPDMRPSMGGSGPLRRTLGA